MAALALPAPGPLREIEHAHREMTRLFELWLLTPVCSGEGWDAYARYLTAVDAWDARVRAVSVTERRKAA